MIPIKCEIFLLPFVCLDLWAVPIPVLLNDVWRFDPVYNFWTNLSAYSQGSGPSERFGMGFTAGNGKLYIYGGITREPHLYTDIFDFWRW